MSSVFATILIVYLVGVIVNYQIFRYDIIKKFGKMKWRSKKKSEVFAWSLGSWLVGCFLAGFIIQEYLEDL